MNILILNGSPKGKTSITVQTAFYLEKRNPQYQFSYLNIAQKVKSYEKNFEEVKTAIENADFLIWVYPVYTLLIPSQMQHFLELMETNNISLKGKYNTQFTTSKHFFDTTSHKYLNENLLDMEGNLLLGFSADMEDLLEEKGRNQVEAWFDKLFFDISIGHFQVGVKPEPKPSKPVFQVSHQVNGSSTNKKSDKSVVVVTNCDKYDENLNNMIEEFIACCDYKVTVKNVAEFPFQGGCIGCLKCSVTAKCIYSDNFEGFLRNDIQSSDAIVYAFTIKQHYTGYQFKCYDDRQFCNGHRSVTHGMPVGYIISGEYSKESNLQTLVEARCEVGQVYLSGVATDEGDTASDIQKLAKSLDYALHHNMDKPANFYGVGGTKIFRDLVYLMQGLMKADHLYYKENGIYDFPHNNKKKMLQMKFIGGLMNLPGAEKKMGNMGQYIIMPYTKLLEETKPKQENS